MPSNSKRNKGKRSLAGQVDFIALSRDLVDAVESGVYIVQSRRFVYVNPFFAKLTGYSRDELIGMLSSKLVLPQDRPLVKKKAIRNLKSRLGSKPYEYRFIKKNGETIWVMERVSSIEYMGQKAALGNFVEITERKRLEEALAHSEKTYRTILEQMYDSYYEVDLAGNFTFVNDSVCRNLGYSSEEMVGQSYRFTTPPGDIKPLLLAFNEVFRTGIPNMGCPHGILRKDGSIISVESSISLRENEQGEVIGFRSVSRDITGHKKLEEELQKLASIVRYSSELVNLSTPDGKMIFLNEAGARMLGIDPQEVDQFTILQVIPGHLKEKVQSEVLPALLKEGTWEGDLQYLNISTGVLTDVHASLFVINDRVTGEPLHLANVSRDITERKNHEKAVQESEMKYRLLVETASEVILVVQDFKIKFFNRRAVELTGYSVDELQDMPFANLVYPDDLEMVADQHQRRLQGEPFESIYPFRYVLKNGTVGWVEINTTLIDWEGSPATLSFLNDITERKRVEDALRESEAQLTTSLENAPDGIYIADFEGIFLYGNRRCEEMIGYKREELIGKNLLELNILPVDSLGKAAELMQAHREEKPTSPEELELIRKDGRLIPVEINTSVVHRGGKKVVLAFVRDISERKKAEDALRESEAQYRLLAEHMINTVGLVDMDLNNIYDSPSAEKITGFTHNELMELPMEKRLTPESLKLAAEVFMELIPRVMADPDYNPVITLELEVCCKDGTTLQMENVFSIIRDENGKPVSILRESKDITERKHAEAMLRQSEAQYRLLADHMINTVGLMDMDLNTIYESPSAEKITGFTHNELMELPIEKRLTPESLKLSAEAFAEKIPRVMADPDYNPVITLELEIYRKDGTTLPMETVFSTIRDENGKPVSILRESKDITDRKKAEAALREGEGKYRNLFDNAMEAIFVAQAGKIVFFNPQMLKITGYSSEEIMEKPLIEFIYPDDREMVFDRNMAWSKRGTVSSSYDFRGIKKNGDFTWVQFRAVLITWEGLPATLNFMGDITDRKLAEEALRESEEQYRSLVENINDVFYTLDNQGNITYVSPVVERFTLYKVSELIGKPFVPLIYPDDLPPLLDSMNRLVSGQLEPWEFRIVDKDGRIIFVRTSSRPVYEDGQVVGITALMTDITERKQMEQKLEEMATHDFLTGLPNRVLLLDRFTIAAALAQRNKAKLAIMSLDLDKFKSVNDTLGHDAGDQVLKTISMRLTGIIRASDTLARVGGDEFILVTLETSQMQDSIAVAQKILDSFKEPLVIDSRHIYLSTSIGIAIYPEDGQDLETLTKKSDAAMYYSKGHGRNQFKFFSDGDVGIGEDHKSGN